MTAMALRVILCLFYLNSVASNLVKNPGFETNHLQEWDKTGGQMKLSTSYKHGGKTALESYDRKHQTDGPSQVVSLQVETRYWLKVYVKQTNDGAALSQTYAVDIHYTWTDGGNKEYRTVARQPYIQSGTGWFLMEGIFLTPQRNFSQARLVVSGPDPGVGFLLDDFSLEEITYDPNWEMEADSRISKHRKNNIHFVFTHESSWNPADITVTINQKRHLFGFGAEADIQRGNEYNRFFYNTFNWASVGNLGWPRSQTTHMDYHNTIDALKELQNHRVKVRGKTLFSDPNEQLPTWLNSLDSDMLNQTLQKRISYMTHITGSLINQWDVLNNELEDQFYKRKMADPHYPEQIYEMMHQADPSVKLFINEDHVLTDGEQTKAYYNLVRDLKAHGLNGIAAKSYFTTASPDPVLLKLQLDILASSGLPVWISEFNVANKDVKVRADMLEAALRTFFSHPAVEGVMLKDFYDYHSVAPETALFTGNTFKPTPAGQRYLDLIQKQWSTHVKRTLDQGKSFTVSGYHGDYDVTVYHNGKMVMSKKLQLGKFDIVYQMHITGKDTDNAGSAPSNPGLGTAKMNALQCRTRTSNQAAVGGTGTVVVKCEDGEWLTGCMGMKNSINDGAKFYRGQFIVQSGSKQACKVVDGTSSETGVYAVARCCRGPNLICEHNASPSMNGETITETSCPANTLVTGCAALQQGKTMPGSYPSASLRTCMAENKGSLLDEMVTAVCCSGLLCKTATSNPSEGKKGSVVSVSCGSNSGYVMTSCNGRSLGGKLAGTTFVEINGETMCYATNGANSANGPGVEAVAVCCRANVRVPVVG